MICTDHVLSLSSWIILTAFVWIAVMLIFSLSGYSRMTGYIAVSGASFIFGACGIPMKSPAILYNQPNAFVFSIYTSFGILLCSLPLVIYLVATNHFVFTPWAVFGSVDIIAINYFAFCAVQAMGYAKAPAIWCSIGMITAFLQGSFIFHEPIHNYVAGYSSIPVLILGVTLVILSQKKIDDDSDESGLQIMYEEVKLEDENDKREIEMTPRQRNILHVLSKMEDVTQIEDEDDFEVVIDLQKGHKDANMNTPSNNTINQRSLLSNGLLISIIYCIITGICDGSLMTPYKMSKYDYPKDDTVDYKDDDTFRHQLLPIFNYLASFGISSAVIAMVLFISHFTYISLRARCSEEAETARDILIDQIQASLIPGCMSGILWAAANFMSVHGTAYLGMKIGFPLTQTCVVFNAGWGIFYFKEMDISQVKTICCLASGVLCVILGSYLLAVSG